MKLSVFAVASLLLISSAAISQTARLNVYGGYVFQDKVDSRYDNTNYYNGTIEDGFQWGGSLEYMIRPNYGLELMYLRQDTKAPMNYYKNGNKFTNFDLGINYIMLGGMRYFQKPNTKVEGFGGALLGAVIMNLKNPDNGVSTNKTYFSWGIKGGANIWASPRVGIKLQAQLLSAVQSVGGGFYFGTGGAGAGVSSYSTLYQFTLGGGLVFKMGGAAAGTAPKPKPTY